MSVWKKQDARHKGGLHSFATSFSMALYLEFMRKNGYSVGEYSVGEPWVIKSGEMWLLAMGVRYKIVPWTFFESTNLRCLKRGFKTCHFWQWDQECHWHKHKRKSSTLEDGQVIILGPRSYTFIKNRFWKIREKVGNDCPTSRADTKQSFAAIERRGRNLRKL